MKFVQLLPFFFLISICFFSFLLINTPAKATVPFSSCENQYLIRGSLCYNDFTGTFVGSYSVAGWLGLKLTVTGPDTMYYEITHYIQNTETGSPITDSSETGVLSARMKSDGNYTEFLSSASMPSSQKMGTLSETVEAQALGIRYIQVDGEWVRTYAYLFVRAELTSIFRVLWFFDPETGVLLRLYKSIETNLFQVQWIEYLIEDTSLRLDVAAGPTQVFFANQLANIFASIGAVGASLICVFYLIQKKVGRAELA